MFFRIPIRIHPLFWLLALLIGFLNSREPVQIFIWVIVILLSVLIHELGHALTGKLFSQKVSIELFAFGGMTYREGKRLSLGKEFLVVLAGPLFGFILFVISFLLLGVIQNKESLFFFALHITTFVNLIWTILNLLPVLPLDGGHLFSIIMEKLFGFKGVKAANLISFLLGSILAILFFVFGQLFLGILFFMLAFTSFRSYKQVRSMSRQDQDSALKELFEAAEKKLLAGEKQEAIEGFKKIREKCSKGVIYTSATETLALLLIEEGKKEEGYALLNALPKVSLELIPKLHELAFLAKDYGKTIELAKEAFQLFPVAQTAIYNAIAYAQKGEVEPAIGWLECALNEGIADLEELLKKPEWEPIRETPAFKNFIASLK